MLAYAYLAVLAYAYLAVLAYAYLVVLAATERARHHPPTGLIPLTCNEIHHLFNAVIIHPISSPEHHLH
jgi:hypothetical protein